MDSRLNHQIAAIRIAEAHAQASVARAAREARGDARPSRRARRVPSWATTRFAHR
ncbi:MAG: hypothetical protein ABI611_19795 [Solirubrobacteraceae bacterium]